MSTNETDISPDSGEEIDEGGDIQAIGENLFENQNWRILKLKNDIYRFFLVEFVNNTKMNRRKCIRCETIVLGRNRGASSMHSHLKFSWKNLSAGEFSQPLRDFLSKSERVSQKLLSLYILITFHFAKWLVQQPFSHFIVGWDLTKSHMILQMENLMTVITKLFRKSKKYLALEGATTLFLFHLTNRLLNLSNGVALTAKWTLYPFSKFLGLLAWTQKGYFLMND